MTQTGRRVRTALIQARDEDVWQKRPYLAMPSTRPGERWLRQVRHGDDPQKQGNR